MPTKVVWSRDPYTYEDLKEFDFESEEMKRDYYSWGKNRTVSVSDTEVFNGLSDGFEYSVKKTGQEAFQLKEKPYREIVYAQNEKLELVENYNREIKFVQKEEILTINDVPTIHLLQTGYEQLSLIDADERLANTVFFDLEIDNNVVTDEDFTNYIESKTPIHYSPIRPLYPGEYEYKDAIVGVQLSIPPSEGRFGVVDSILHVDIPDTVEKGTVVVSNTGPSTVRFTKKFYKEAKVFCALVEAEEPAIVEQTYTSLTEFTVGLKSLTNPSKYVNGTIDWLADGY